MSNTPKSPEFLRRLIAYWGGYFWMPCAICGRFSGGHEWRDRDGYKSVIFYVDNPGRGRGICPWCTVDDLAATHAFDPVLNRAVLR